MTCCSRQDIAAYSGSTPIGSAYGGYSIGLRFLHGSAPALPREQNFADSFVLPAGIEPAFYPSQGYVLSIERREQFCFPTIS